MVVLVVDVIDVPVVSVPIVPMVDVDIVSVDIVPVVPVVAVSVVIVAPVSVPVVTLVSVALLVVVSFVQPVPKAARATIVRRTRNFFISLSSRSFCVRLCRDSGLSTL